MMCEKKHEVKKGLNQMPEGVAPGGSSNGPRSSIRLDFKTIGVACRKRLKWKTASLSRLRAERGRWSPRIQPSPDGQTRGRMQGHRALAQVKGSRPFGEIHCGDQAPSRRLSGIQPKSPCLRRGPHPRTTAFPRCAAGNAATPRVSSLPGQATRPENIRPRTSRGAGTALASECNTCRSGFFQCCSGSRCETEKYVLPWNSTFFERVCCGPDCIADQADGRLQSKLHCKNQLIRTGIGYRAEPGRARGCVVKV